MNSFKDLTDEEKDFYYIKASNFFDNRGLLYCNRTWDAWHYKTMTENDFYNAEDDDSLIAELAEEIFNIVQVKLRKNKIENILKEDL